MASAWSSAKVIYWLLKQFSMPALETRDRSHLTHFFHYFVGLYPHYGQVAAVLPGVASRVIRR